MAARKAAWAGGGIVLVTASLYGAIISREGNKYVPYKDIGGVWTVCGGVTGKHVLPGKTYTEDECRALNEGEIEAHGRRLMECITRPISQAQYEALASWAYNVGTGAACSSTLIRKLNAGNPPAVWCEELMNWRNAGGKPVKGLTNRRIAERKQCLS